MDEPQVSGVVALGDMVRVGFQDGVQTVFVANSNGPGEPRALEAFWVERLSDPLVLFHSQHQRPVKRIPFGFVLARKGVTIPTIVTYWQAARRSLEASAGNGLLVEAWHIVNLGDDDLQEIAAGLWPLP